MICVWEGMREVMNILVCDDEVEIVEAIEIYLRNESYNVLKAYDGIEAISLLEKNDVQLIIMDIMMPRMDGFRVVMKIREASNIPIIMLSLIHISEPTRRTPISYAVFCL